MKQMTDRELLDAIDRAMKQVAETFRAKREAEAAKPEPTPADPVRSAA